MSVRTTGIPRLMYSDSSCSGVADAILGNSNCVRGKYSMAVPSADDKANRIERPNEFQTDCAMTRTLEFLAAVPRAVTDQIEILDQRRSHVQRLVHSLTSIPGAIPTERQSWANRYCFSRKAPDSVD